MKFNFSTTFKAFLVYIVVPVFGYIMVAYINGFASKAEVESLSAKIIMIDKKTDLILEAMLKEKK